jgi:pyruvate kinase
MRRTKIVATLGPATSSDESIGALIRVGVDVTRFNFSHGDHQMHLRNAEIVRTVAKEAGRNVAVMQDLQGPKIRTGEVAGDTELVEGNRVVISAGDFVGDASRLSTTYDRLAEDVKPGDRLLIDDGLIGLKVESIDDGDIVCEVLEGGPVSSHKGLNFPDSHLSIHGLTPKDIEDLRFGMEELHPDWVATSFVRTGDDIEEIIQASDGIMVARGDLAVELSNERVPIEQKRMIARCRRLGKPVIVATQMLDSMIRNPRPTRAEVSDVANAIFDRADAVMTSGETAVGRYPLQSIQEMDRICRAAESAINYGRDIPASASWGRGDRYDAVTHAACELAEDLQADAILTSTQSGLSSIRVARFRPPNRILAVSPVEHTVRIVWGVTAIRGEQAGSLEERFLGAIGAAEEAGHLKEGDQVIMTGGTAGSLPGSANVVEVYTVGEDR